MARTGAERGETPALPQNYEGVVNLIASEYERLSARFQQIARFLTQNPNAVALESIHTVAKLSAVHPSSLVRFAQALGYSGFKDLQSVFRTRLATAAPGFRERVGALRGELARDGDQGDIGRLKALVARDVSALQNLLETVTEASLSEASRILTAADTVFVAGQLRSEPLALLMRYFLTMLGRRVILLDSAGGLAQEMAAVMGPRDALVAIAFRHYAKEVVSIAETAAAARTPIVAITDSLLSPLAKDARVLFTVPEDEYTFSRSIAAPICLVQCVAVACASILQAGEGGEPRIPTVTEIARIRDHAGRTARKR